MMHSHLNVLSNNTYNVTDLITLVIKLEIELKISEIFLKAYITHGLYANI